MAFAAGEGTVRTVAVSTTPALASPIAECVSRLNVCTLAQLSPLMSTALPGGGFATTDILASDVTVWRTLDGPSRLLKFSCPVYGLASDPSGTMFFVLSSGEVHRFGLDDDEAALVASVPPVRGFLQVAATASRLFVHDSAVGGLHIDVPVCVFNTATWEHDTSTRDLAAMFHLLPNGALVSKHRFMLKYWADGASKEVEPVDIPVQAPGQVVGLPNGFGLLSKSAQGPRFDVWEEHREAVAVVGFPAKSLLACLAGPSLLTQAVDDVLHLWGLDGTLHGTFNPGALVSGGLVLTNGVLLLSHPGNVVTVWRFVRPSRVAALALMATAWTEHSGAPELPPDGLSPAKLLARALCLRRFCRPRGASDTGRPLEVVEPFAQAIVLFL